MNDNFSQYALALDLGSSKVLAIVAGFDEALNYQVLACADVPSRGIKNGFVENMEEVSASILSVLDGIKRMTDTLPNQAYWGVSGIHLQSQNSQGMVTINNSIVTENDKKRVMETAKAIFLPAGQKLLFELPQNYKIDNREIRDPLGMSGMRLEGSVHLVTGEISAIENIRRCIERAGLKLRNEDMYLNALLSSSAVLTQDEKDLGVVAIDIGAGTTDLAVFLNGYLQYSGVLPTASQHITNDIAYALSTPTLDAEELKIHYGWAKEALVDPTKEIEVPGIGDRPTRKLKQQILATFIEARAQEILGSAKQKIDQIILNEKLSGVVLTGGGAKLNGILELAEEIFGKPVRIGIPRYKANLADVVNYPQYSSAMGIFEMIRQAKTQKAQLAPLNMKFLMDKLKDIKKNLF